ncbi:MAG: SusE domain-containing protein [Gelidibacter sp.]
MKKIFAILLLIGITSCTTDDVQDRPIIEANESPELVAPEEGAIYTLNSTYPTMIVDRFVWNPADFGGAVATTYTVEIDNVENQFANPKILGSVASGTQLSFDVATLNGLALSLGATPFSAYSLEGRVKADVGGGVAAMYSDKVTFIVTPYTTEAPKLYVVGDFLADSGYGENWKPENAVAIAAPTFGDTNFEGYVYMNTDNGEYKFLPTNTSFDGDYGDDGTFTGKLVQENEVNAKVAVAGYYLVKANTTTLSYSIEATTWGITGSATPLGWPDNGVQDQKMTYNKDTKKWEIIIALTAGGNEFKFRANGGWDLNLGDDGGDGILEYGGANMSVPQSGTYKVELDLSKPRAYTYTATLQ